MSGTQPLDFNPETSVFLNCPYDAEYQPLFDAIVFATIASGFTPRCAIDTGTTSEPRITRIMTSIVESQYSIHDLSRCRGEGDSNLARFNMPLELGMAMALRWLGQPPVEKHDWFVMVPGGHPYAHYVSDLAGYDPEIHDGTELGVTLLVMKWLRTRRRLTPPLPPAQTLKGLPAFRRAMVKLRKSWGPWPPWEEVVLAGFDVVKKVGK